MSLLTAIAVASFIMALVILLFFRLGGFYRSGGEPPLAPPPPRNKRSKRGEISARFAVTEGIRGEPHTCPVCAAKFEHGETVRSSILPPTARGDRLLHISGCMYCVAGERRRECPVCGAELSVDEYLTARIFQRPEKKTHVHIVGCNHCRLGR
ncbi:MAG: hypothetical protein LBC77_07675 [Spirochaetaceae bacterium]|nr:hypothetical protein [Spirochaetaceae bacterium]